MEVFIYGGKTLNLVLGEAAAFEKLGGTIYENSPAISIKNTNDTPIVKTDKGEVRCRRLLLCGNGYLDIVPKLNSAVFYQHAKTISSKFLLAIRIQSPIGGR